MASYHMQINTGGKGAALEHAQYIDRDGRFTEERYGEVAARGHANMPEWAREDTTAFWRASDEFERANGNTYREYELALPRELSRGARVALVERFAEQELGTTRPYQWAIHTCTARDGKEQPHVHLMFSDRQLDGIERGPEQFFKRYNAKNPERGGSRKAIYGADKAEAALVYEGIRKRWATVQNQALEMAGVEARVDHRSLAAQGIHREPEVHRGPAVSGIEGRGEVSQVGERQREQRQERSQHRAAVVAEVRVVTREEVAAERVAARERRDLAREVTGEDRTVVLAQVEADRREQIGRAQAAAERRVERRQGLGIGKLKEKLLTQARALRERLGHQLERVKEWVAEHFAEPLAKIKEQVRGMFEGQACGDRAAERAAGKSKAWDEALEPDHPAVKAIKEFQKDQSLEESQRQGREAWLALRKDQTFDLAAEQRRARENWLAYKADQLAKEQAPAADQSLEQTPTHGSDFMKSMDEWRQAAAERWAERQNQQEREPDRGHDHEQEPEVDKSQEKSRDYGIDDDFDPW
jgi:hypothetical protein